MKELYRTLRTSVWCFAGGSLQLTFEAFNNNAESPQRACVAYHPSFRTALRLSD